MSFDPEPTGPVLPAADPVQAGAIPAEAAVAGPARWHVHPGYVGHPRGSGRAGAWVALLSLTMLLVVGLSASPLGVPVGPSAAAGESAAEADFPAGPGSCGSLLLPGQVAGEESLSSSRDVPGQVGCAQLADERGELVVMALLIFLALSAGCLVGEACERGSYRRRTRLLGPPEIAEQMPES